MVRSMMVRSMLVVLLLLAFVPSELACAVTQEEDRVENLAEGFTNPPHSARPWIYWWWLNGYVSKEGIRRDLAEMQKQGISGALVFHAGQGETPKRTQFMSLEWREFFRFAVDEAAKRDITIGLNLCGGWNAGGPWVELDDAAKMLIHSTTYLNGPMAFDGVLSKPTEADETYHDVAVLAWPTPEPIDPNIGERSLREGTRPARAIAQCQSNGMRDVTDKMDAAGQLVWEVPEGNWLVIRFGWRLCPRAHTKFTGGDAYLEIDPLRADAMDKHFAATAGVVIEDVRSHVGKTFKYVHIDSGEIGEPDWTQTFHTDFQRLRGYDPFPYLAAKSGCVVNDPATTERFLEDYERTIGDLMIANYYGRLGALAHKNGLGTHSEAAGYQKPTVDSLRSLGCNDICMSEFWSRRSPSDDYIHQLSPSQLRYHDGIKNASSAAHTYGRRIVQAEAFTVMRDVNYDRDLFDLKDLGDRAFCAGLNRNMLCFYVCQADQQSKPGYGWPGVGMEFDRHVTWWPMSHGWLTYLSRCQYLLQAGTFVADVCYLQGEWVPAYVPAQWAMDPPLPPGCDCDTINAEALVTRVTAGTDGELVLPDGQSYRYLVLWQGGRWRKPTAAIARKPPPARYRGPPRDATLSSCSAIGSSKPLALSPQTVRKLKDLVESGVTLIGPRPTRAVGLAGYPDSDAEVRKLSDELWGQNTKEIGDRKVGQGRVIWGRSLAEIMQLDGAAPDLEIRESPQTRALPPRTLSGIPNPTSFNWIHRRIADDDVYFIANLRNAATAGEFVFRIHGMQPELWDAVSGELRTLQDFTATVDGRTRVSMQFEPRQSFFVVFRRSESETHARQIERPSGRNFPKLRPIAEITGPWEVQFDPQWGGPEKVVFEKLEDWTTRPEEGIKYYSGSAVYRRTFDLPDSAAFSRLYLDLGEMKNLASVRLNGSNLGVVWTAPWRVEITAAVKAEGNSLEVEVVNLWMNRLIGDARVPREKRLATSNAGGRFKASMPLLSSGLLGPVTVQAQTGEQSLGSANK